MSATKAAYHDDMEKALRQPVEAMTEHWIIIRVYKDCDDKPMTEKQVKKWVEEHFRGCDYGKVEVKDVITENKS